MDNADSYILDLFGCQDSALDEILRRTPEEGLPAISVQPHEGRLLEILTRLSGAGRALEIGTLGGYSGSWIARGLAPGGRLITIELEPEHARVAEEHFRSAGVWDKVEIRVGDGHEVLAAMAEEPPFDLVFIDAEKTGYCRYYEWAVDHTRAGAVIAAHNALRGGQVFGDAPVDAGTEAIRDLNRLVAGDCRVVSTILPAGDGMLVAVRVDKVRVP